ncbi:MAG TPA: hypothetical protein VFG50_10665, partial [Rhodothermales bacterium]|nr:hypothetical protein [Rhodothermales bacterium]
FAQAEMPDTLWTASVVLGDAYAMEGHAALARRQYERGLALLPAQSGDWPYLLWLRRLVADRPDVVRVLVSGLPPERKAAVLEAAGGGGAVRMLAALQLAEGERFREAAQLMEAVRAPQELPLAERLALERQRLAWTARFFYHAREPAQAVRYAEAAAHAWRSAGDVDAAAWLHGLAEKYRWADENL